MSTTKQDGTMLPHAYERTLVAIRTAPWERLAVWLEGTNVQLNVKPQEFNIAGGPMHTNTGIRFTKEQLLEIANCMKEGATLNIAACDGLKKKELEAEFERCNNMVQVGPTSFQPKQNNPNK